eukprot:scaffold22709_cov158-Cylindrotheca_fusiformis.AAC.1
MKATVTNLGQLQKEHGLDSDPQLCITRLDELCRKVRNCPRAQRNPTLYYASQEIRMTKATVHDEGDTKHK